MKRNRATMRRSRVTVLGISFGVLGLAGCGRGEDLSPPRIVYGEAECELCRMIVSEERFAAAAVIVTADGVGKVAFDDVGCLVRFLQVAPRSGRVLGYVHDFESRRWVEASKALYIRSESLQTPMASQLAACESRASAEDLLGRFPGATATLDQLIAAGAVQSFTANSPLSERSSP